MVLKLPQVVPYEFLGLVNGFRASYYEDLAGLEGGVSGNWTCRIYVFL